MCNHTWIAVQRWTTRRDCNIKESELESYMVTWQCTKCSALAHIEMYHKIVPIDKEHKE